MRGLIQNHGSDKLQTDRTERSVANEGQSSSNGENSNSKGEVSAKTFRVKFLTNENLVRTNLVRSVKWIIFMLNRRR